MNQLETSRSQALNHSQDRPLLAQIAERVMLQRGFAPEFSIKAIQELQAMHGPATAEDASVRDLTRLIWCSIDNDDSLDLDQVTVAIPGTNGTTKILVGIADVDALVKRGSALDDHASQNTTSVYTAGKIFPMLPARLSTDLTSLNHGCDRLAVVIEMEFATDGTQIGSDLYRAVTRNHAKLAYRSVAAWLDGTAPMPEAIARVEGLAENIRIQDSLAAKLKALRFSKGALELEILEPRPVFAGDQLRELDLEQTNRAMDLIAEFMVAANGVSARFLAGKNLKSLRRIVRVPKHWDRIVELAKEQKYVLPVEPDPMALEKFLNQAKTRDPVHFPDLSLSVVKLLGAGEYVVEIPGQATTGHFGLGVKAYSHSTAPNRRFPDLITQRLLKAAIAGNGAPYAEDELVKIAKHCTDAEDAAKKVERAVIKSAAAILLQTRIGEKFDGIVTGASIKGTWVRVVNPPVEGKVVVGFEGLKVGQTVKVELMRTNVERGLIDFNAIR